jgi:uncharacterized protein (DUF2147 family)
MTSPLQIGRSARRHAALLVAAQIGAMAASVAVAQSLPPVQRPPTVTAPPAPAPRAVVPPKNPLFGLWIDHTADGAVEIGPCPETRTNEVCAQIFWLKDANDARGQPLRDGYNEDDRQRKRPICGLPVMGGLKRQTDGTYDEGWIYDPRQGKSFSVELTLLKGDKLQVKGYKGLKFLSKTFIWTRSLTELPRCVPPPPPVVAPVEQKRVQAPGAIRR